MVLMGRPFDVLTCSVVQTFGNGDSEVTITCPNSGRQCVMNTYPRGELSKRVRINTSRYNDNPGTKPPDYLDHGKKKEAPSENFQGASTI